MKLRVLGEEDQLKDGTKEFMYERAADRGKGFEQARKKSG